MSFRHEISVEMRCRIESTVFTMSMTFRSGGDEYSCILPRQAGEERLERGGVQGVTVTTTWR